MELILLMMVLVRLNQLILHNMKKIINWIKQLFTLNCDESHPNNYL